MQKQLSKANSQLIGFFLKDIGTQMYYLMIDKYGNYFCQELLLSCSGKQRLDILENIKPMFMEACKSKKGTHTVQKLIELMSVEKEEKYMFGLLEGNICDLSQDDQGIHVVQKVLECVEEQSRQFLFDEVYS